MTSHAVEYAGATPTRAAHALRRAQVALAVCIASGIPFVLLNLLWTSTPNDHHFRHAADYWITALGIPYLGAPIVLLASMRSLQAGRDGRLGTAGLVLTGAALATIVALLPHTLAVATTGGVGPVYPIAAFVADIGMLLFCAGAFRARLLPRPLVAAWLAGWIVGGALGPAWGTLVLVPVYAAIAVALPRRLGARP